MCILYTYHMEYETCWVARCDRLSMWDMTCRDGMKLNEIWLTLVSIMFIFVLSPKMILIHHVTLAYLHDLIVSWCIFSCVGPFRSGFTIDMFRSHGVHLPTLRFCVYGSLWSLSVGQTQPIEHYLAMHLITWSAFPTIWYEMHLTFICFLGWLEHQLINWGWKRSSHPKIKSSTDLDGFFMCFFWTPLRSATGDGIDFFSWVNLRVSMLMVSGDYGWIARTCWKWKGGQWGLAGPQQSTDNSTNISDKTWTFSKVG